MNESLFKAEADRFIQVQKGVGAASRKKEEEIRLFEHLLNNLGSDLTVREVAGKLWPKRVRAIEFVPNVMNRLRQSLAEYNRQRQTHNDCCVRLDLPKHDKSGRARRKYCLTYVVKKRPALKVEASSAWKPFRWRINNGPVRTVPQHLWLSDPINAALRVDFDVDATLWRPPKCPGYTTLRKQCWAYLTKKDTEVFDGDVWRVRDVTQEGRNVLKVSVQPAKWLDYYATNLKLGKEDETIRLRTREVTVDEWLKTSRGTDGLLRGFANAANLLAVNLLIITRDGYAVIVQQQDKHSLSPSDWVASSSGTVALPLDSKSLKHEHLSPDPWRTAKQETLGEVGVQIDIDHIKWTAFGVGLAMGSPALLGEIRVDKTYRQVRAAWDHRADKHETCDVRPLKLEPKAVLEALDGKDENGKIKYKHRTYFELGLALALIRKGKAELCCD
ncbi:MAG: hypothetical protein EPO07_06495 [Verrucomicrobia bacterium]|nr:MAG: hypothetical protein EPO07_06495 [Verrucomicrobiota bacterium]